GQNGVELECAFRVAVYFTYGGGAFRGQPDRDSGDGAARFVGDRPSDGPGYLLCRQGKTQKSKNKQAMHKTLAETFGQGYSNRLTMSSLTLSLKPGDFIGACANCFLMRSLHPTSRAPVTFRQLLPKRLSEADTFSKVVQSRRNAETNDPCHDP